MMNILPKRKIREATRRIFISIALILFLVSVICFYNGLFGIEQYSNIEELYKYKTNFQTNYSVNLKDNLFIDEKILPSGRAYLSDVIDTINFDFIYDYKGDAKSNFKYTYDIKGIIKGLFSKDGTGQEVWNREYTLVEPKTFEVESDEIKIQENVLLNYKDYNSQALLLTETYTVRLDTKMYLQLNLNIETVVDGEPLNVIYKSDIAVDLGGKTTEVTGKLEDESEGNLTKEIISKQEGNKAQTVLGGIALVAAVILINRALVGTTISHNIKSKYKEELNKILRICQDKIVHVSNQIDTSNQELVDVKDFQEIIKLSEELGRPILCWKSDLKEEAWFTIVGNGILYRYILNDEN